MTGSVHSAKFCACVTTIHRNLATEIFVKLLLCQLKLTFIYKKESVFQHIDFFKRTRLRFIHYIINYLKNKEITISA